MKTLIDLRPGDILYEVKNDASIVEHEVKLIKKNRIETSDRYFEFSELQHTSYAVKTEYMRMPGYPEVLYTNRYKALKQAIKVQRKRVDDAKIQIIEATNNYDAKYNRLTELYIEMYTEEN